MKNVILIFLLISFSINAQNSLVSQFKKTINYIYLFRDGKPFPNGTGFFVGKINKDSTGYYTYLVTAKHVLQDKTGDFYRNIIVRYNNKQGSISKDQIPLVLSGVGQTVFTHIDKTIDLAIIPVGNTGNVDLKLIPLNQFINRSDYQENNIDIGTEVFFTGLFTPYVAESNINPITRFGRLCLIPNERIEFIKYKRDLILIESSTFGGNSGSPVMFSYIQDNQEKVRLAGVVLGSFVQNQSIEVAISQKNVITNSLGISAITPSEFIIDILNSEELKKRRGE